MASPFVVNAAELLRRSGTQRSVALTVPIAELGIVDDPRFPDDAEVTVRLELESMNDGIVVDGEVSVPWHGTCRRCLADTAGVSTSEVSELYQRTLTDPDAFEIVGDQLDLKPIARELVLLDAPSTPVCTPECKGLCPVCGVNRNDIDCSCDASVADPRWAALDQFREQSDN